MVSYLLLFVGIANIAFIILCVVYIKQMNKAKSRPSQDNNHHALPQNNKRKNDWQNRRKDFRVRFDGKPCMAEFIEFKFRCLSRPEIC